MTSFCWKSSAEIVDKIKGKIFDQHAICVFLQAPLDIAMASPPFVSLSISDSSADLIAEPVKEQPEQPSPVSVLDLPFQEELLVATEFKELSSDLEGEL